MEPDFWLARWRDGETAFHEEAPNPLLVNYIEQLGLKPGDTIFVPLCGKAVDLDWLLNQGFHVIGIELSEEAVEEVFRRNDRTPSIHRSPHLKQYSSEQMTLYVDDFFNLTVTDITSVDAVYDRGALVALPASLRDKYSSHLRDLTNNARQLVVAYDHDRSPQEGPPFSLPADEITRLYGQHFNVEMIGERQIGAPLNERCTGWEQAWYLEPI